MWDKINKYGENVPNLETGENVPYLEITEVVSIHFNIVINGYQQDSRVLYTFFLINHLVNY